MRYDAIYKQVMDRELEKAKNEGELGEGFRDEWLAISVCMQNPKRENDELYDEARKSFGYKGSFNDFEKLLRKVVLFGRGKRIFIEQKTFENMMKIKDLLKGKTETAEDARSIMTDLLDTTDDYGKTIFPSKYLICKMLICDDELSHGRKYELIAKRYMDKFCQKTIQMLVNAVIERGNLGEKVTANDIAKSSIERNKERLKKVIEVKTEKTGDSIGEYVQALEFRIENLKAALDAAVDNYDDLKETIDQSAEEAKATVILEFYKKLNAKEYGSILDNSIYAEQVLNEFRRERVEFEDRVNSAIIILRQMLRFLKSTEISTIIPLEDIGKKIEITDNDLAIYNYYGSEFSKDEKKYVEIVTTGWKYGDEYIISYPEVREAREEI